MSDSRHTVLSPARPPLHPAPSAAVRGPAPIEPASAPAGAGSTAVRPAGWSWLLIGTVLLILSQHGNPDIAVAGWLFAIPLLRLSRRLRPLPGLALIVLAHLVAGAAWVVSIRLPTDGVPWEAIIGCALLNALLALPFLIDRLVAVPLRADHPLLASLVFPSALVGAELLVLTVSPFGTVFGSLADSQHGNLPLLQLLSITGGYGVSFLMAWFGSAVAEIWQCPRHLLPLGVVGGVLALVLAGGSAVLAQPASAATVRVAGVTPARSLDAVSSRLPSFATAADHPALVRQVMAPVTRDLLDSTRRQAAAGAKIIIWSEAATLVHQDDLNTLYRQVGRIAERYGVRVQVAAGVFTRQPPHGRNVIALIGPDGSRQWQYDKMHPVPGMESITPGTRLPPVLSTTSGRLAGMICYDLDYADSAGVDADIVMLPASDWPGFDRLHTENAQLRAIEHGYAVVRQDAHGTAATFDARGRTLASVDYFRTDRQEMVTDVPVAGQRTVYSAIGNAFGYGCVIGLAALTVFALVSGLRRRPVADLG